MNTKKNILAVDDLATQLAMYRLLLGNRYSLRACKSPLGALDLLKKEKMDLIIADIEMPEMTGFEFLREIRQSRTSREVPVIIISSHKDIAEALKNGANDYIKKPVNPDELREKVKNLLDSD
ncbi:MAG: response regulator [Treponema sp.]|jgi:PleD family two-component response regulator|nr:response regulator [Treponema sp.]